MDKIGFWLMVGVVSVMFIYGLKMIAANTNIQGLKDFAAAI
jgi:hypothetical protein